VIPCLSEDAIIRAATLKKWKIKLDIDTERGIVDAKVGELQLV